MQIVWVPICGKINSKLEVQIRPDVLITIFIWVTTSHISIERYGFVGYIGMIARKVVQISKLSGGTNKKKNKHFVVSR